MTFSKKKNNKQKLGYVHSTDSLCKKQQKIIKNKNKKVSLLNKNAPEPRFRGSVFLSTELMLSSLHQFYRWPL